MLKMTQGAAFLQRRAARPFNRTLATMVDEAPSAAMPGAGVQEIPPEASTSSSASQSSLSASERRLQRRQAAISPSRRAPSPLTSQQDIDRSQTIHLPNIVFRLVRNGPNEAGNPYIATFRVPPQLTKPDIVSYLAQIYGLNVTSISTVIQMGEMKFRPGQFKAKSRKKTIKKAIIGMEEPFWFPDKRPLKWLNDNFEKWVAVSCSREWAIADDLLQGNS